MKRLLTCLVAVFMISLCLHADPPRGGDPKVEKQLSPLMHMKLEKSKTILEGLAMEDFEEIAANARSLHLLSTEAGWNVIQTTEYASQSQDFRRAADLISEAADQRDIHRATMGYVALTVRCVECHSYMRKQRAGLLNPGARK